MRLIITKLLFFVCFYIPLTQAQTLVVESIQDFPELRYLQHFNHDEKMVVAENGILFFNGFHLTHFTKNHSQQTNLSDLLPKTLRRKISSFHESLYFYGNEQLIIRNANHLFVFTETKRNFKFKSHFKIKNKYPGRSLYEFSDKIYLFGVYNEHEKSDGMASGFLSIDTRDSSEKSHPIPFPYLPITHFGPNNFIAFDTSGYLTCDPFLYKIKFYNFHNILTDSIYADVKDFTRSDTSVFNSKFDAGAVSVDPILFLPFMHEYLNQVDRLWVVQFINKNTIFVRLTRNTKNTPGGDKQYLYDHIWKKTDGVWELKMVKDVTGLDITSNLISQSDLYPHFIPGSKFFVQDGYLYYTVWSSSNNTFPQAGENFYGVADGDRSNLHLKLIKFSFR